MENAQSPSPGGDLINVYVYLWSGTPNIIYATEPSKIRVTVIEGDPYDHEEISLLAKKQTPELINNEEIDAAINDAAESDKSRKQREEHQE